jgi:hypothetical protein
VIEGSGGNVPVVVVTMPVSPVAVVAVPVVSGLPVAVPVLSVAVLTASGLM